MRAAEHTVAMLAGWRSARVDRADLAVRRPCGSMLWQRNRVLEDLPLAWARAENAHQGEIYIRPARGFAWPMVLLDDVAPARALSVAHRHGGVVVQTSPTGGCHLWLPCTRVLDEAERYRVQRTLAEEMGADLGSVSGEHLGRLAGFKNWKRGGCWVNVLWAPEVQGVHEALEPPRAALAIPEEAHPLKPPQERSRPHSGVGGDASPSGQEWGWVCRMLETGRDPEAVYLELLDRARLRRGQDAEGYARRTVERAMVKVRLTRG